MIKIGIVGCGKMADQHALQIRRIPEAKIIGVCDNEPLMAEQMAERYNVQRSFSNIDDLLAWQRPDVIHITTPPPSHFTLGKKCLEAGSHVYMEKPFTLFASEADELLKLAAQRDLKIIAGHNVQFAPAMLQMRRMVKLGALGGPPVHLESHYCYNFSDAGYAKSLLGDKDHWVRKLPGSLLQNIISHGIAKIAEFLSEDEPIVIAHGFTSPFLKSIGENDIVDEVRVIIRDKNATTAFFTFSSQIGTAPRQFRLYGRKNSIVVDDDFQTVIMTGAKDYPSYLKFFVPPFGFAKQYLGNFGRNFRKFLARDFHMPNDSGLKTLIEAFYEAIAGRAPLPLSPREILLTAKLMDTIFVQIHEHVS